MIDLKSISAFPAYYKCRVNIRPDYKGHKAKESVLFLNGFEVTLQFDNRRLGIEPYQDEAILTPGTDQFKQLFWMYGLKYLAEGDVTILEQIQIDQ